MQITVVPSESSCHLDEVLEHSEKVGPGVGLGYNIWPISMYIILSCFSKNCSDHFSGLVKAKCRTGNIYPSHGPGVRHNKAVHGCLASITSGWAQGGIKAVGVWWTKNPAITVKGKPTLSSPSKWETTSTRGPVRSDIPSCHSPSKSAGMYWIFCWNQSTSHAPTSVDEHLLGGGPQIRGSVRTWNSSPGSPPAAGSGSPRALPQHFLLGNTGSLHLNHLKCIDILLLKAFFPHHGNFTRKSLSSCSPPVCINAMVCRCEA